MPTPRMPDRNTPAANADILGEDASNSGNLEGLSEPAGQAGASGGGSPASHGGRGEARPGKDINQTGFLKDKDNTSDKPGA